MSAIEARNACLLRLVPQIESEAHHLVLCYRPDLDPSAAVPELVQEACLHFLERAEANPDYLDQPDAAHRAVLDGWNACRRQTRRNWQVRLDPVGSDGERFEHAIPADAPDPEEETIKADLVGRVQQAIANLKLTTRGSKSTYLFIIERLMQGVPPSKIMDSLDIRRQNWTYYRRRLQHAFMALE